MTKEEIFKKNFPQYVTEKGVCLSPFWDLFDAGIEAATSELNKGIIQVLTKEKEELTQAKDIIKKLVEGIKIISDPKVYLTDADAFVSEAEQFLKEK